MPSAILMLVELIKSVKIFAAVRASIVLQLDLGLFIAFVMLRTYLAEILLKILERLVLLLSMGPFEHILIEVRIVFRNPLTTRGLFLAIASSITLISVRYLIRVIVIADRCLIWYHAWKFGLILIWFSLTNSYATSTSASN